MRKFVFFDYLMFLMYESYEGSFWRYRQSVGAFSLLIGIIILIVIATIELILKLSNTNIFLEDYMSVFVLSLIIIDFYLVSKIYHQAKVIRLHEKFIRPNINLNLIRILVTIGLSFILFFIGYLNYSIKQ